VPIPVTCRCGQSFAAGDHLAGRTVQCPKCKSPLAIPAPQVASTPLGGPAQQPFAAGPSIFDDAGMRTFTGKPLCPECQAEMQPGAILCVNCGYNVQLGRKMSTNVKAAVAKEGGHGDAAMDLLRKAARNIDEDKEAEKKKLKEGMPWWMLGAIFLFALSTCIMLLVLPAAQAINLAMGITFLGAGVAIIYYLILLIIIAFKDRPLHGLLLIVNPGFAPLYILSRWEDTNHIFWGIIRTAIGTVILLVFLLIAAVVAWASQPKPGGDVSPPLQRAVVMWSEPRSSIYS
jgi:hypothetical protein